MDYIRNFKGWVASVVVLVAFLLIRLFSGGEIPYQESVGEKYTTFYSVSHCLVAGGAQCCSLPESAGGGISKALLPSMSQGARGHAV